MYAEVTKEKLIHQVKRGLVSDFIITTNLSGMELIALSTEIQNIQTNLKKIYWLNGANTGENYPSFKSYKLKPRARIYPGGIRWEPGGVIFPQDEPIILILENFDDLDVDD